MCVVCNILLAFVCVYAEGLFLVNASVASSVNYGITVHNDLSLEIFNSFFLCCVFASKTFCCGINFSSALLKEAVLLQDSSVDCTT